MRSRIKCLDILIERSVHQRVQERLAATRSIATGGSFSRPFWNLASDTALLAGVDCFQYSILIRQKLPEHVPIDSHRNFEITGMSQKDRNVYPDGTAEPMKRAYRSVALSYSVSCRRNESELKGIATAVRGSGGRFCQMESASDKL